MDESPNLVHCVVSWMLVSAQRGMVPGQEQADSAGKDHSFQWKRHKAFREWEHLSRGVQLERICPKVKKKKKDSFFATT